MQPRSERVFDAQVVAGRAAYRYSRSVQIDYGIAARRSGSDYQTWHRANETKRRGDAATGGQRGGETERRRDGMSLSHSISPSPRRPVTPSPHSPSPQTVQNFVYN